MRTVCHNTYGTDRPHCITRTRVAQEMEGSGLHIFVSQNNCHPRVMSRSLPHLTLTKSTSSLSLTYLNYLSVSLNNKHKTFGTRSIFTLRSSTAEWRVKTNSISHNLRQERPIANPSSLWDGWWTRSWWDMSWQCKERHIHDCFKPKVEVPLMFRQRWTPERGGETPSPHKAHYSSYFSS